MAFLSSPGFSIGGKKPPTPFYPVNSVVPFYGPTPTTMPAGWTRWTGADTNYILYSPSTNVVAGTQSSYVPASMSASGSFSTGSHTYEQGKIFTTIYHATQSGTAGPAANYLTGGSHTHGNGGTFSYSGQITPDRITVNFLRSTEVTYELPVDSVIFRGDVPTKASATAIITNGTRYITGSGTGAGTLTGGNRTQFIEWTTATAGSHYHSPSNNRARGLSGAGFNYDTAFAGSHFHSISRTVTQSIFGTTTLLNAWQILSTLVPESNMIIMYLGSLSSLTAPWYVCNGTKGTINLQNRYIAMSNTAIHGSELSSDTLNGTNTVNTSSSATHAHIGSYTNFRGTTPSSASHQSQFWFHDHSFSMQTNSGASPPRVALHFIQYKG